MTRKWWQNAVLYQIYPRSFMDSNGDGVGDLRGIIHRLDYLADLGIDAVWLSPIFTSPMADFGYDVADYTDIDPLFGDLDTFDELLAGLHARGIKLLLDWVPNHSSDEHPWFQESRSSRDNVYRNWYMWRDPKPDGSPPNNWQSFFGGSAWEWDAHTEQYYLHLFHKKQPDLNWRNPNVVQAMYDTLRFWLDRGVDGFRMDVITFCYKHPDLPDNPPAKSTIFGRYAEAFGGLEHVYDINQPESHQMLREVRTLFDRYEGQRVTIGETWFLEPQTLIPWYGDNDELHIPFNFMLMKAPWDATAMRRIIADYEAALPEWAQPSWVLGSHDEHRLATRHGPQNHRSAGLLLLTLRGTPMMYNGDELGMQDVHIPVEKMIDPQGLGYPGEEQAYSRDPNRTPFQWSDAPNAGFTTPEATPWLPLASDYETVNAAAQAADLHSTLSFYKRLLAARRTYRALHAGNFALIEDVPPDVLAYVREAEGQRCAVFINFAGTAREIDASALGKAGEIILSTQFNEGHVALDALRLQPHEGVLMRLDVMP